jgi:hypothetical protein
MSESGTRRAIGSVSGREARLPVRFEVATPFLSSGSMSEVSAKAPDVLLTSQANPVFGIRTVSVSGNEPGAIAGKARLPDRS